MNKKDFKALMRSRGAGQKPPPPPPRCWCGHKEKEHAQDRCHECTWLGGYGADNGHEYSVDPPRKG